MSVTPPGSRSSSPRCAAGRSVAARAAMASSGTSNSSATAVAARTLDRLPSPSSGVSSAHVARAACATSRRRAVEAAILDARGARRRPAARCRTSRRGRRSAGARDDHARVVGVGDEHVARARLLENLRLGVGDRVGRREEAEVRVADVGPDADVGLGDADERRGFPRRDSCPVRPPPRPGRDRSSSSESGRPMWLFRFPLFRNTR